MRELPMPQTVESAQTLEIRIQFLERNCSVVWGVRGRMPVILETCISLLADLSRTQSLWYPLQLLKKASEYGNAAEISGAQCQILFSPLLSSTPDAFPRIELLNF